MQAGHVDTWGTVMLILSFCWCFQKNVLIQVSPHSVFSPALVGLKKAFSEF